MLVQPCLASSDCIVQFVACWAHALAQTGVCIMWQFSSQISDVDARTITLTLYKLPRPSMWNVCSCKHMCFLHADSTWAHFHRLTVHAAILSVDNPSFRSWCKNYSCINFSDLQCEHMLQDDASASSDTKWYKNTHNKHIHTHTHTHSYWFAIQCFFGHAGCSSTPGIRGTAFITMYLLSYIGSGFLLRYAEGATYLAVVQVISGVLTM